MCGRYSFNIDNNIKEIENIINNISEKYKNINFETGEIFPTDNVLVLKLENNNPEIAVMSWGFPKWDGKGSIINARGETVREKEMFFNGIKNSRCVVLSTGFYEWNQNQSLKERDKYLFSIKESEMLYMAGIFDNFNGEEKFVIMTQDSNRSIEDIHHRMPILLNRNELIHWLRDDSLVDYFLSRDDIYLDRILIEETKQLKLL